MATSVCTIRMLASRGCRSASAASCVSSAAAAPALSDRAFSSLASVRLGPFREQVLRIATATGCRVDADELLRRPILKLTRDTIRCIGSCELEQLNGQRLCLRPIGQLLSHDPTGVLQSIVVNSLA